MEQIPETKEVLLERGRREMPKEQFPKVAGKEEFKGSWKQTEEESKGWAEELKRLKRHEEPLREKEFEGEAKPILSKDE